jgi:molecular chaperone GrpE
MTKTTEKPAPANQETTETTSSPKSHGSKEDCSDATEQKVEELTATLQRLQAEFENFKKRNEKEKAMFIQFANKQLLAQLLPIIDNFERALETNKDEGITLIHKELTELLETHGVKVMDTNNTLFDPHKHEAMLQEASDKPVGTILQTLQKGYILGDAVLRPARVKIAKGKEDLKKDEVQGDE